MAAKTNFQGSLTALVTPFKNGALDEAAFRGLVSWQIEQGSHGLVPVGTTGESPTLTACEYEEILAFSAERIGGRVPYIVGCGSADTARAIAHAKLAAKNNADAILVVTPYYNKGTTDGIVRHYHMLAEESGLPTLLYHVPGRTGVRLSAGTVLRIAEHPLLVGIKEASGDMEFFASLSYALSDTLTLYSGCDCLILPSLALGGGGVVSVVSNLFPREISRLCHAFFEGQFDEALTLARRFAPLIDLLFADVNPAPLKCALALENICKNRLRLPLSPVSEGLCERIHEALLRAKE
jgi:4-hydroxy-tetrahydrodipicolinate synthase